MLPIKISFADNMLGWLSPELYLRRPPSKNQQYRIDNLLQAAAERGVKVNIIVYKEV
jgi:phospholipase D1/2